MRHPGLISVSLLAIVTLAACDRSGEAQVDRALADVSAVQDSNFNDVMLTVADPDEAVSYFTRAAAAEPDRVDLQRGLATSLVRAGKAQQAVPVWEAVTAHPNTIMDDNVDLADALIRSNRWDDAEGILDQIPPTHETFKRYRLEAMVADSNEEWDKADSFYQTALGLTTKPAGVLNNWGFSNLTRGNFVEAGRLFGEAITHDSSMFTAKNNLVLARGAQRNYDLPVVPMTQMEKAQLQHTMALSAIKQNDISTGKTLLQQAIDTHPQHFEAAVRSLAALDANVTN